MVNFKDVNLDTARATLRPFKESDLADFYEYAKVECVGEAAGWSHHKNIEESKKIMKAQASRGVDFEEGKLKDKITQIISLLIPMFVISFKRADELSNAMEARGYVIGDSRTKLDELKLKWRDYLSIVISLGLLALVIWSRFYVQI